MFESAELGHRVDKRAYDRRLPALRYDLLEAQLRVQEKAEFPVIVLLCGEDGSGRGDLVNLLLEWMDPRHVRVHASGLSTRESERPPMGRFWRALPPKGKMGMFFGGLYEEAIADRVYGRIRAADLARHLILVTRFERMLVDEGALVVKLWLHLTKKAQRRRFEKLESSPATSWRVSKDDWAHHERYTRFRQVSERALHETNTAEAPWTVVEAADDRFRNLTVGEVLRDAMRARLDRARRAVPVVRAPPPPRASIDGRNVLEELDLSKSLGNAHYEKRLPLLQGRLNALSRHKRFRDVAVVIAFEGNDAAGKGGTIRRVTRALDARYYDVVPIAAPTDEERAQPYLWRFWRHVPKRGHFTLFDRSWYGRVLVERVEGLAAEPDWMRAYPEIVDFEDSLSRSRIVVLKFWLAISRDEQLVRFRAREKTPFKRFKITADDWRNRKKWLAYERAVCDMVDRTSTDVAPWHLIEANDKKWARVRVLETIGDAIENALRG
jgi:polyphosphate:AMP phosphotransferase